MAKKDFMWAGMSTIEEGQLGLRIVKDAYGKERHKIFTVPAIYSTKKQAQKYHCKVKKIWIEVEQE